jgi:hypothetical protein
MIRSPAHSARCSGSSCRQGESNDCYCGTSSCDGTCWRQWRLARRRAEMASGRAIPRWQGLLQPGPGPGPPLHRDRPPHRAGHGRSGHLRHHRRPAPAPHQRPGPAPGSSRPAAASRPWHDRADRPRDRRSALPPGAARPRRALAGLETTPPGPRPLVPPSHSSCVRSRSCGSDSDGCCGGNPGCRCFVCSSTEQADHGRRRARGSIVRAGRPPGCNRETVT